MILPRITACIVLVIMAGTWATISIKLGVMVAVSDNFMYLGGLLLSVALGKNIIEKIGK